MLVLPEEFYSVLRPTFKILGFSKQEEDQSLEDFEDTLFTQFTAAVAKKLPEQEREGFINLANSATTTEKRVELEKKLLSWMNKKEISLLMQKLADKLFNDVLKKMYKSANAEQKKKLEEMFKVEALK